MNQKTLSGIILIVIAFGFGIFMSTRFGSEAPGIDAPLNIDNLVLLSPAKKVNSFSLNNQDNQKFTNENLAGKWSLLFFGYTSCPDVCPTTLNTLAASMEKLKSEKNIKLPQVVFISVDPDRDSYKKDPSKLKNYISFFSKDFIAATGSHEELKKLTSQLGTAYEIYNSRNKKNYEVGHSAFISIVNPKGQYRGFISTPHTVDSIVNTVRALNKNG